MTPWGYSPNPKQTLMAVLSNLVGIGYSHFADTREWQTRLNTWVGAEVIRNCNNQLIPPVIEGTKMPKVIAFVPREAATKWEQGPRTHGDLFKSQTVNKPIHFTATKDNEAAVCF